MRFKDIALIKILQYVYRKGRVSLSGEDGLYRAFEMKFDKNGRCVNEGTWPFSPRTLLRYLQELVERGLLKCTVGSNGKEYSLNSDMYYVELNISKKRVEELSEIMNMAGEYELSRKIISAAGENMQDLWGTASEEIFSKWEQRIGQYAQDFTSESNPEIENIIKIGIIESRRLRITYRGKQYRIFPVAIVKQLNKKYLFYIRKKMLAPPFRISLINKAELLEKMEIDTEPLIEDIKKRWGVDTSQEVKVEVFFWGKPEKLSRVMKEIDLRKSSSFFALDNGYLFKDTIKGETEFKNWLRQYVDCSVVITPNSLREEMVDSAWEKLKRYGVSSHGI